ncbi:WD repeat-containing protein 43 [Melitaea cinxia]|uniref:WD repeat-containing protein 43 n=1 Tax=Melitaea cinxia TaxID=113334 RepID=UPI001E27229E|nr:WD repeat-containing protein 43 [Melitaea cinxia]
MAEAAFSEDGKYYSAISQDGRLRIWDTETNVLKQEYTPDLHLSSPPSCLQWLTVSSTASPPKGSRRKSVSEGETQCIALGTSSGKILLYSISQAKVETVLKDDKKNHKIQSLDWHRKYGLFSCSNENYIQEWDIQSSSVRNKYNINITTNNKQGNKVSAIRIVPHNQNTPAKYIIAASWQVRLWRLHDNDATVVKCLGHNAAPRALLTIAQLNKSCWLIEGSQTERLLSFWDVTITEDHIPQTNGDDTIPSKRQRKKSFNAPHIPTPTYNFVLEDAPRIIDVELKTEDNVNKLNLVAATRSGVVHYYGHMLNGASSKPIKPSVTIQVTTEDAQPLPLQCCKLPATGDLLLGYNNGPTLLFEKIIPDLKTKTQVLIRGEFKQKSKGNQSNEVNKVRSEKQNDVTYIEPMGGVSRKRPTVGGKVEVSMEARLENLTVDVKSRSKSAVNQNMTKLLMQGLHSNDKGMVLSVLQRDDPAVARRTVASLPPDYVPLLLQQLADLASRRTGQCAAACTWLSAVLQTHSALLLATLGSSSSDHLTQLLAIFTHRRSHLCQLLNLKGRLDLTIAQRSSSDDIVEQQPVLEYNDSSSDEEMEIERYQSGSEQSWDDDGESPASHSDQSDD